MNRRPELADVLETWFEEDSAGPAPDAMFERTIAAIAGSPQRTLWSPTFARLRHLGWAAGLLALLAVVSIGALLAGAILRHTERPIAPSLVTATVIAAACPHPTGIDGVVGNSAWIVCPDQVRRIDATTGQTTAILAGSAVAADAGEAWVAHVGGIDARDAVTLEIRGTVALPGVVALSLGPTAAWALVTSPPRLVAIDRASLQRRMSVNLPGVGVAFVNDGRSIWVAVPDHGQVLQIDDRTGTTLAAIDISDPAGISVAGERAFIVDRRATAVAVIDLSTDVVTMRPFEAARVERSTAPPVTSRESSGGLVLAGASLWEVSRAEAVETDVITGQVDQWLRIAVPADVALVGGALVNGHVLLVDAAGNQVLEVQRP